MKKFAAISLIGFFMLLMSGHAMATQTLDCMTERYLIRMHVNSFDEVTDIQIKTPEADAYMIGHSEIDLKQFGWQLNGFGNNGNYIHLTTQGSKSGFPAFELNVKEADGLMRVQGTNEPCQCDWGL